MAHNQFYAPGELIFHAGATGRAWRVLHGSIRLDEVNADGCRTFFNLALSNDILGSESMLLGTYRFSATALTHCEIAPWPSSTPEISNKNLFSVLDNAHIRTGALLALRKGEAQTRIQGLIQLLSSSDELQTASVTLPSRKDIAEITALRLETVSRIIANFVRTGALLPIKSKDVHSARSFSPNFAAIAK